MVVVGEGGAWGTWEELILAGAVLRHGTQAWGAVASELRARTLCPFSFTAEACEAKYGYLQKQYFGCTALFEELKKRRVEVLKRELEKSDDSIGSLESKLVSLKAEKGNHSHGDHSSSQIDSPTPIIKSEGVESFGIESSKDGLSAGSFTQDIRNIAEMESKPEVPDFSDPDKVLSVNKRARTISDSEGTLRKKRGERKRKGCSGESKEGSIGESENLASANVVTSTIGSSSLNNLNRVTSGIGNDHLMGIFNSVAENKMALVFRRKLDSQKRARYRKTIRRHVDFDTIRSRIASCAITSVKELFRDLLLLANNALVFYSKRTREYKSARSLRDIVTKAYKQKCKGFSIIRAAATFLPLSPLCNLPVKPRSIRPHPHKQKLSTKLPDDEKLNKPNNAEISVSGFQQFCKKISNVYSKPTTEALMMAKKGFNKMGKAGRGSPNRQAKALIKEKKRARRR